MKYFISSDIHSFYTPYIEALNKAGFDINNPNHVLVICGDLFDRGTETIKLYNFIRDLPKDRRVLIRGNHEYLLSNVYDRKYLKEYDWNNGTGRTVCDFYKASVEKDKGTFDLTRMSDGIFNTILKECVNWIRYSNEWVNYFEVGKYVCVHSFIPTINSQYISQWRDITTEYMWECATWVNPGEEYKKGLFDNEVKNGKVLVCGHFHASIVATQVTKRNHTSNKAFTDNRGIIALDTCTARTKKVNVMVYDDYDKSVKFVC